MRYKLPGVDIKTTNGRRVCIYSVAEELFLLTGNLLCLNRYCGILMQDPVMLEQWPSPLKTEIAIFSCRVRALEEIYARRLRAVRVVDQPGSNVVSLKSRGAVSIVPCPLSLAQRRQKTFETKEEVYVFVLGMCGLALHPSGEAHTVDLDDVFKPIEDWWRQVVVAQELCTRLLPHVSAGPAGLWPSDWVTGLEGLNRELLRAVWRYRSKRA